MEVLGKTQAEGEERDHCHQKNSKIDVRFKRKLKVCAERRPFLAVILNIHGFLFQLIHVFVPRFSSQVLITYFGVQGSTDQLAEREQSDNFYHITYINIYILNQFTLFHHRTKAKL